MDYEKDINTEIVFLKSTDFGTWAEIADRINEVFDADLTANAVRKRYYRQSIDSVLDELNETEESAISSSEKNNDGISDLEDDVMKLTGSESIDRLFEQSSLNKNDWDINEFKFWESNLGGGDVGTLRSIHIKRKVDVFATDKIYKLVNELKDFSPHRSKKEYNPAAKYLLAPCLFDVHIGKPSDKDIEVVYANALDALINKAKTRNYDIGKILLPIGNDLFHFDNLEGTTTKGTAVSRNMSMYEIIDIACKSLINGIEQLSSVAPVHVATVAGNHDHLSSFWMGKLVSAWFRNNSNVFVDDGDFPRKYFYWEKILLGMTHGNEEKTTDLPMLMSIEAKQNWARASWYEWLTGHLHKRGVTRIPLDEKNGVTIRYLSSLGDSDEWHNKKGFVGNNKMAEGLIYSVGAREVDTLGINVGLEE